MKQIIIVALSLLVLVLVACSTDLAPPIPDLNADQKVELSADEAAANLGKALADGENSPKMAQWLEQIISGQVTNPDIAEAVAQLEEAPGVTFAGKSYSARTLVELFRALETSVSIQALPDHLQSRVTISGFLVSSPSPSLPLAAIGLPSPDHTVSLSYQNCDDPNFEDCRYVFDLAQTGFLGYFSLSQRNNLSSSLSDDTYSSFTVTEVILLEDVQPTPINLTSYSRQATLSYPEDFTVKGNDIYASVSLGAAIVTSGCYFGHFGECVGEH